MIKKSPEGSGLKEIYTTTKRVVSKLLFGDNSLPQNVIKTLNTVIILLLKDLLIASKYRQPLI